MLGFAVFVMGVCVGFAAMWLYGATRPEQVKVVLAPDSVNKRNPRWYWRVYDEKGGLRANCAGSFPDEETARRAVNQFLAMARGRYRA